MPHSSGPETFLNHHGWLFCSLPKKDDHDNRRRSNPDHVHAFQTATLLVSQPSPMMSAKDPLHANLGQSGLAQSNGAVRAFSLANPLRTRSPPPPQKCKTSPAGMTPHSAGKFRPTRQTSGAALAVAEHGAGDTQSCSRSMASCGQAGGGHDLLLTRPAPAMTKDSSC